MKRFKNILFVSDFKTEARNALDRAVALSERNHADLTIVDFVDDLPDNLKKILLTKQLKKIQAYSHEIIQEQMKEAVASIRGTVGNVSYQLLKGRPFVEIIRKVLRDKHDLVIIPSEGKTRFKEHIFGSTSMHLMRKCPCPVWVIKPTKRKKYFRILAAVDLNEAYYSKGVKSNLLNIKIMDLASSLGRWDYSDLHIIYAWDISGESLKDSLSYEEMRKLRNDAQKKYKKEVNLLLSNYELNKSSTKVHIVKGAAVDAIPAAMKKYGIDMIVMGSVCRTGLAGVLIGNTAEEVLQQVNCSVLTVKPDGFVSPIK